MSRITSPVASRPALAAILLVLATPALAHHPMGGTTPSTMFEGLLSGLGHPVIGLDHLAFLVGAALLAALLGGSSRYLVPLAFVAATAVGALVHFEGLDLPASELLVAGSVVIAGLAAVGGFRTGPTLLAALFALAGLAHGYAYGEAIVGADTGALVSYLAGFSLIQYALMCAAIFALSRVAQHSAPSAQRVIRGGALGVVAIGGLFLVSGLV